MAFRLTDHRSIDVACAVLVFFAVLEPSFAEKSAGPSAMEIPEVEVFIGQMATKHGFDQSELELLFKGVRIRTDILKAISKPAEGKPWFEYRSIFINDERIRKGARFMETHAETLMMSRRAYGVPEEMTTAILGVETGYGRRTGRFGVLDALVTLAFRYPPRSKLFRQELEQFLLLSREEDIRPHGIKGSYAGAMGIAQFMPTSYRLYAVDFDGDGKRDLSKNMPDAIGSVANYFKVHGWRQREPIAMRASVAGVENLDALSFSLKSSRTLEQWVAMGVEPVQEYSGSETAALIQLTGSDGPEYWLVFHNFYVITRYNKSTNYAMAVFQLSREIESHRQRTLAGEP